MPKFIIKRGSIWSGGKLVSEGGTVELDDADREYIDPTHEVLQSAGEAKLEAEKLAAESKLAAAKAKALADLDAKFLADSKAGAK